MKNKKTFHIFKAFILFAFIFFQFVISQKGFSQSQTTADATEKISWQRKFDDKDRLSKLIDPAGKVTSFTYSNDAPGKTIVTKTNAEGSTKFEYNDRDLLTSMQDGVGVVNYQYDAFRHLMSINREGEPALQYKYDTEGRITSVMVGVFYNVTYTYDFLGRLSVINTPAGKITYEYYTGDGEVERKLPNGVKTNWKFDANGQQLRTRHLDPGNYLLAEYTYQYRQDGLIEAIKEKTQTGQKIIRYEYDNVSRLTHVVEQPGNEYKYEYDLVGNRTKAIMPGGISQECKYDWAGRLTSFNGKEATHDAAGNLNSIVFGDSKMNYQYNQDCQLIGVNNTVSYKYDGNGNLIERQSNGEKTKFISNPLTDYWQPLVMDNAEGKSLIIWDRNTPLIIINNGIPEYILSDQLGSARITTDSKVKLKQHYDYDSFGIIKNLNANANVLTPGFAGLIYDSQSKLYLTQARSYEPHTGRFMQVEPKPRIPSDSQKDFSMYAYCGSDPVNFIDRNGKGPETISKAAERELLKIDYAMKRLQIDQWNKNYPNNPNPNYLRCDQWQTLVDNELRNLNLKYWNPVLIKEISPIKRSDGNDLIKHYFNALEPVNHQAYNRIIDLWRPDDDYNYKNGAPNRALFSGRNANGDLTKKYTEEYTVQNPNFKVQKEKIPFNSEASFSDKTKVLWNKFITEFKESNSQNKGPLDWVVNTSSDILKSIDDFIAKPVYGDEIPSTVGGVYLGGSGQALNGIGQIEGLSLDANNNLVLLSKKGDQVNLPPLRIDDIVTVFRSVYQHGEAPYVSIDPDTIEPRQRDMNIRHGEATENTYVGWVLYEADRLMKTYMFGKDNITQNEFTSNVPGYSDILNALFSPDTTNGADSSDKWERFWIVPAEVDEFTASNCNLTILDVPLKVKTQVMKWQKGKLVNNPKGVPSNGAKKFIEWFTKNYDLIAKEQFLIPPSECGLKDPVPVFIELKKMAIISALAEKMRDEKVPMPFWMRDYRVVPVEFEKKTPPINVVRNRMIMFGGVQLSAPNNQVKQIKSHADLEKLREEEQKNGEQKLKQVMALSTAIHDFNPQDIPLQIKKIEIEDQSFVTTQMPGAATQALAPCRIEETDLIVPISGGKDISLSRNFNSFFNPEDVWGKAWTMNLPYLEKIKIPVDRSEDNTSYMPGFELLTPLNSIYAKFSEVKEVPALKSKLLVPDADCNFFGLSFFKTNFLSDTTYEIISKDGGSWHFTKDGDLIATEKDGFRTIYLRDGYGNVNQIVGLYGKAKMATIDLKYDNLNRVMSASGKNEMGEVKTVSYEYDSSGKLSEVISAQGKTGYTYKGNLVAEVSRTASPNSSGNRADKTIVRRYEYNSNGQLIAEYDKDNKKTDYQLSTAGGTTTLKISQPKNASENSIVSYDPSCRPLTGKYDDGTKVTWTYPSDGSTSIQITTPDSTKTTITESPDKTKRTIETTNQPTLTGIYDNAGRLTQLDANNLPLFKQQWSSFGNIESVETATSKFVPHYDEDGLTKSVTIAPAGSGDRSKTWSNMEFDVTGKPVEISDYTGQKVVIVYDNKGEMSKFISVRDSNNYGYEFSRNDKGQITSVNSSWDKEQCTYDSTGALSKLIVKKAGRDGEKQSAFEFNSGNLHRVTQFDGGQMEIAYNTGQQEDLPSQIKCPNGLQLNYKYDSSGNVNNVSLGNERQIKLEYDDKGRIVGYSLCKK